MKTPAAPEYDIIVSNPPYIPQSDAKGMDRNVLDYEPGLALFVPDADPMKFYRPIATYASGALLPGGMLYVIIWIIGKTISTSLIQFRYKHES